MTLRTDRPTTTRVDCACIEENGKITGLCGLHSRWLREEVAKELAKPIPMRLLCPTCGELHVDEGEFATKNHHTHACQACGHVWRPAIAATVGVRFLPGFKNEMGIK